MHDQGCHHYWWARGLHHEDPYTRWGRVHQPNGGVSQSAPWILHTCQHLAVKQRTGGTLHQTGRNYNHYFCLFLFHIYFLFNVCLSVSLSLALSLPFWSMHHWKMLQNCCKQYLVSTVPCTRTIYTTVENFWITHSVPDKNKDTNVHVLLRWSIIHSREISNKSKSYRCSKNPYAVHEFSMTKSEVQWMCTKSCDSSFSVKR
jgi:hypothetical protein